MPKAKPFSDDDEKTTIESQWEEDEASTTVEQGEVADRIRALGANPPPRRNITGVTGTGASSVEEPTVDDQHADPALSALMTPVATAGATLVVTSGSDTGQQLDVQPGKTFTIGRGLDNDFVLTDIAVSRKHFDLRNDDGSWVIVDRGSGNGTVVNGNLEDNPFMLANGDMIEIGTTMFRFDYRGPEVARRSADETFDVDPDDELSTVAGKPLHQRIVDQAPEPPRHVPSQRPKTLPPPVPLRPRSISQGPGGYPSMSNAPASTLPMPQMANRAPVSGPQSPTILGAQPINLANLMPTTIPGQGSPMAPTMMPMPGAQPNGMHNNGMHGMHPMYSGYPQATEIPPHSVHAQMLVVQTQNRRGDGSTAHVPPAPYHNAGLVAPQQGAHFLPPPQLSKRTKYIVGGAALTLFAALATIAIIKSGGKKPQETSPGSAKVTPIKVTDPKLDPKSVATTDPKPDPKITKPDPKTPDSKTLQPTITKIDTKPDPKVEPKTEAKVEPKVEPKTEKKIEPKTEAKVEPKVEPKTEKKVEPKTEAKVEPKVEPKTEKKIEPKTEAKVEPKVAKKVEPKTEPKTEPKVEKKVEKRVATASADIDRVRDQADALYRIKKFNDAASLLKGVVKSADASEAKQLTLKAGTYVNLGRAYNRGMAPGGSPTETFESLRQASSFDQNVGNAFEGDIAARMKEVAPKAAIAYVSSGKLEQAHLAVQAADQVGAGGDNNVKAVRQKLESEAGKLYAAGMKELDGDPSSAKDKFKQIKGIVDAKSPWYAKATKQLTGA